MARLGQRLLGLIPAAAASGTQAERQRQCELIVFPLVIVASRIYSRRIVAALAIVPDTSAIAAAAAFAASAIALVAATAALALAVLLPMSNPLTGRAAWRGACGRR